MKKLALVTCLYDSSKRNAGHRSVDWMLANADYVLGLDRELVIFTEPELEAKILDLRGGRRTKILPVPFEKLIGEPRVTAVVRGVLQHNANKEKVTPSYVQLMWAKYAMLETALEITTASHIGWIDLSITHVAKTPPEGVDVFADPSDRPRVHVLRCFSKRDVDAPGYWANVQGHLAGGLIVGARDAVRDLVRDFWSAVDLAIARGLAPLDEGLLSYVVGQRPHDFSYSYGDYEDIVRNHDVPRGGHAHRQWIIEDAGARGLPDPLNATAVDPALVVTSTRSRRFPMGMYEHDFIKRVISKYPGHAARRIVETGTCAGYSTRKLSRLYQHVDTVELSEDLSIKTRALMNQEGYRNVSFHVGDSAQELHSIVPEIQEPCVFYLDAHWSGDETVDWDTSEWKGYGVPTAHRGTPGKKPSSEEQVPLLTEMRIICEEFPHRAILYIDDFGLFSADGRGRTDVGFVGNDWSHLHVNDLKEVCKGRLVDWVVDGTGLQVAIVLAATYEPVTETPRVAVTLDGPLLGLVMIVKNEAHGIVETLRSFAPYIDYWTIVDTGSTDNTADLIREALRDIPGDLVLGEFVDFSTTRNLALSLHGEKTRWTIMPDADDCLVGGDALRKQLPVDDSGPDGFMVNLRRGHLDYYLPLVLRSNRKLRYIGRVHEYIDRLVEQKLVGVEVRQDQPAQSKEASQKRWERDAKLLEEDLKASPHNPRTLFYLAQTYECLDQKTEAIESYRRRIAVGGWADETFEAHLRLAGIYRARADDVAADAWLLKAHSFMPLRAEPLLLLAQHYRSKDDHALAFLFADRGAAMPRSKSTLFVNHDAQSECSSIASIHGYYLKDTYARKAGAEHAIDCVRYDPGNNNFRSNWAFYAPDVKRAFGALTRQIAFTAQPGWNASNPSVHYDRLDDRLRCIVRTTNYKIVDGNYLTPDDNVIYTRNWMLELTHDLETTLAVEMVDRTNILRSSYPVHGFEDCRLYRIGDRLMCSATVCDFDLDKAGEGPREIVAMQLSDDYEIVNARAIRGVWSSHAQKNWAPFEWNDREEWIYAAINNDGKTTRVAMDLPPPSLDHGRLRGGSQLVKLADGAWIALVHDVAFPGGRTRFYLHRFVRFDEGAQNVIAMTKPFYFEKLGIEFCCGLARIERQLIASYSVDDSSANFAVFDLEKVIAAMDEDFVI